jgi:hypothetical protein
LTKIKQNKTKPGYGGIYLFMGGIDSRITVQVGPNENTRFYVKNNLSKNGLEAWLKW